MALTRRRHVFTLTYAGRLRLRDLQEFDENLLASRVAT